MSRCFPFPPPGYARKCSINEALILPIKLQREREKATSDREREKAKSSDKKKDRKREKKEKREKEKGKDYPAIDSGKQKLIENLYDADKSKVQPKGKCTLQEDVCEPQEKSGVTEEHGRPISPRNVSCSSDSTGNSGEKRRLSTPASVIQSRGNVIRIRLSSRKNDDEPSTSGRNEEQEISQSSLQKREVPRSTSYNKVQTCSNLGRKDLSTQQPLDSIIKPPRDLSRSTSQQVLSKDKQVPPLPDKKKTEREKLSSHEKKIRKRGSEYNNLFENWVPPPLQGGLLFNKDDDNEDWLFGEKGEEKPAKRFKGGDDDLESNGDKIVCSTTAVSQPRAILLPDVGIFARPYTLPF